MTQYNSHNDSAADGIAQALPSCQCCQMPFQARQIVLLREADQAQLIHAQCRRCRANMVLLIFMYEIGVGSVGLVTDLSHTDARRISMAGSISVDDVLGVHTLLQDSSFLATI